MGNAEINVAQLLKEAIGATRVFEIDEALYLDETTQCHVQGEVEFLRTRRGILVRGTFTGTSRLVCSRCLDSFEYPLIFRIEEEFLPSVDVTSGVPLPLDDDPATFTIDDRHVLDLSEAIRQYALLAIPMKPMCRPDCAGLCPQCGANLNQQRCHCPPSSGNPLLDELTKLHNDARKLR
jgi:uncharacterized protein